MVAGSNGVDVLLTRHVLNAEINDFTRIHVKEISMDAAAKLIQSISASQSIKLGNVSPPDIVNCIGGAVPYFIHMLMDQIALIPERMRSPLTHAQLSDIYQQEVLGPYCKSYFNHYQTRLDRYSKSHHDCLHALLETAAHHHETRVPDSILWNAFQEAWAEQTAPSPIVYRELLADLECDWYLAKNTDDNSYSFRIGIMRDWWKRWCGGADRNTSSN